MNCDKVSASAGASAKPMLRNEQPYERLHTVYITCDNQRFFPCNVSVLIFLARRLSVQTDQLCRLIVHSVYSFRSIDILARSADTGPCYHPRERIKTAAPHCIRIPPFHTTAQVEVHSAFRLIRTHEL